MKNLLEGYDLDPESEKKAEKLMKELEKCAIEGKLSVSPKVGDFNVGISGIEDETSRDNCKRMLDKDWKRKIFKSNTILLELNMLAIADIIKFRKVIFLKAVKDYGEN